MSHIAYQSKRCRKIICILRNYVEHAKEMQSSVPSVPEYFLKVCVCQPLFAL